MTKLSLVSQLSINHLTYYFHPTHPQKKKKKKKDHIILVQFCDF
jgi:hypothetical protein